MVDEQLTCVNDAGDALSECQGAVEYRTPLSGTGRSFPRCTRHWEDRLELEQGLRERYPEQRPADFDPMAAGERWEEDDPWP